MIPLLEKILSHKIHRLNTSIGKEETEIKNLAGTG
jgi:hypothetical protein